MKEFVNKRFEIKNENHYTSILKLLIIIPSI